MEQNRRKYERIDIRTELWIGQDGIFTRTDEQLKDLSIGGAFVEGGQVFPVGSVLSFRFRMPGAPAYISCSGIVRNSRVGVGFGVEFLDLSRENVGVIERQIDVQRVPQYVAEYAY